MEKELQSQFSQQNTVFLQEIDVVFIPPQIDMSCDTRDNATWPTFV